MPFLFENEKFFSSTVSYASFFCFDVHKGVFFLRIRFLRNFFFIEIRYVCHFFIRVWKCRLCAEFFSTQKWQSKKIYQMIFILIFYIYLYTLYYDNILIFKFNIYQEIFFLSKNQVIFFFHFCNFFSLPFFFEILIDTLISYFYNIFIFFIIFYWFIIHIIKISHLAPKKFKKKTYLDIEKFLNFFFFKNRK
jgi:hypothetical protein